MMPRVVPPSARDEVVLLASAARRRAAREKFGACCRCGLPLSLHVDDSNRLLWCADPSLRHVRLWLTTRRDA